MTDEEIRTALRAWFKAPTDAAAFAAMHAAGFPVSAVPTEPEPAPRKHWWSNDYD